MTALLDTHPATLVVVEHRVEVWLPLVSRVIVLGDGGVVADGPDAVLGRREPPSRAASGFRASLPSIHRRRRMRPA